MILRRMCEELGATYVKLGQFIASSPTLFPPEYVQEFQKCLDSTPLYSEERPCERQDLLTNIMLAYFEFVTAQGFAHVHIRVPPPTDDKAYIFASRISRTSSRCRRARAASTRATRGARLPGAERGLPDALARGGEQKSF